VCHAQPVSLSPPLLQALTCYPTPPPHHQVMGDDLSKTAPLNLAFWEQAQSELAGKGLRILTLCR